MTPKAKRFLIIGAGALGGIALLALGGGKASAATKPRDSSPEPEPSDFPIEELDEEQVQVILPDPETGVPIEDASPPVVVTIDESEEIEDAPLAPGPTKPLEELAAEREQTVDELVEDIVKEALPVSTANPELAEEETKPSQDPNGTVSLARMLLARENAPGWKEANQTDIAAWQRKVGLEDDGYFGVESVSRMAEEVAILPLVRRWTLGKHWDTWSAKKDYDQRINDVIASLGTSPDTEAHRMGLEASKKREQAQALKPGDSPVPNTREVDSILASIADKGMKEGLENIS